MKKSLTILLLILVILMMTVSIYARTIDEILIIGLTRTDEDIIREQLPFKEGEQWQQKYEQLVLNRLQELGIFSYEPRRVVTETLSEDRLRVVIRVADPSLFYIDPAEYAISNLTMIPYNRFQQSIYNYSGRGEKISFNLNWSPNYRYQLEATIPFGKGVTGLKLEKYQKNTINYLDKGWLVETDYSYWYHDGLLQEVQLGYQQANFNQNKQELILPGTSLYWYGPVTMGAVVQSGIDLNKDNQFVKLEGALYQDNQSWVGMLKAGMVTNDTPYNYYFNLGGAGARPLRGEARRRQAASYLLGSIEYRFKTEFPVAPIVFVDGALFQTDKDREFSSVINPGIGLAVDTPIGIPVRFDLGYNPETGDSRFGFKFGHSIWMKN